MMQVSGDGVRSDVDAMAAIALGLRAASTTVSDMSAVVRAAPGLAGALGIVGSGFSAVFASATEQYADALSSLAASFATGDADVLAASRSYREGDDAAAAALLGVAL